MKNFILTNPKTTLCLVFWGIVTTFIYDFSIELQYSRISEWIAFSFALPLRIFTYVALFASCGLVADHLRGEVSRMIKLAAWWSVIGILLVTCMWIILSFESNLGNDPVIKRFTPDTMASFAPGWTMAEVAIGRDAAMRYTWQTAIGFEVVAVVATSIFTALFVYIIGTTKRKDLACLAPIISILLLMFYGRLVAPWSYTSSFDEFFGDAIVGTMLSNAGPFFFFTLIFGGFTAPAIWVSLIAFVNVTLIIQWGRLVS